MTGAYVFRRARRKTKTVRSWQLRTSKAASTIAGLAAAVVVAGGVAYATIPDAGGVIHGCYHKNSGALRVIDTGGGGSCATGEISLDWNQTGVEGPTGPQGSTGPTGLTGAQGPAGVSGYERVESVAQALQLPANSGNHLSAQCPGGKKVVGGGFGIDNTPGVVVANSQPDANSPDTTWFVGLLNTTGNPVSVFVRATAICITAN